MNEKWICTRCGSERTDKPHKNEICGKEGCVGRYRHIRTCDCGKMIPGNRRYCSIACKNKALGWESVEVTCAFCGETFTRPKANLGKKRQFCNQNCQREYESTRWIHRRCQECGKIFKVLASSINKSNATGHYCSRFCYDRAQHLEGAKNYKDGFERVKREHFSGVQFCAICGTTKRIHIHHIVPFRLTHDNSVDNLIPLCASHHSKVEAIWKTFFDLFDSPAEAGRYVSAVLRSRQKATMNVISRIIQKGVKHESKQSI